MANTALLTMGDVARLLSRHELELGRTAKWSRRRATAVLTGLNKQLGGLLLVNISRGQKLPRWVVSEGALRRAIPGLGAKDRGSVRADVSTKAIRQFASSIGEHDTELDQLRSLVGDLAGRVSSLVEQMGRVSARIGVR